MHAVTKTRLDTLKTASKKVAHKTPEATGELIGNKIGGEIVKAKFVSDENSRNVEDIVISPEKRNAKRIKSSIIKWNSKKHRNYQTIQLHESLLEENGLT